MSGELGENHAEDLDFDSILKASTETEVGGRLDEDHPRPKGSTLN